MIRSLPGYSAFTRIVLRRWSKKAAAAAAVAIDDDEMEMDDTKRALAAKEIFEKKRGRTVNDEFESEVMTKLVYVALNDSFKAARKNTVPTADPKTRKNEAYVVMANCMHSYQVIRTAADSTRAIKKWQSDASVAKLKFSDHWIHDFIERFNFSRQVATKVRGRGLH